MGFSRTFEGFAKRISAGLVSSEFWHRRSHPEARASGHFRLRLGLKSPFELSTTRFGDSTSGAAAESPERCRPALRSPTPPGRPSRRVWRINIAGITIQKATQALQCNQTESHRRVAFRLSLGYRADCRSDELTFHCVCGRSLSGCVTTLIFCDARLPQRIHHGGPAAEGHRFVAPHVNGLALRILSRLRRLPFARSRGCSPVCRSGRRVCAAVDRHHHCALRSVLSRFSSSVRPHRCRTAGSAP